MACPHCGAPVHAGSNFCMRCHKRVAAGAVAAAQVRSPTPAHGGPGRPAGLTMLGVIELLAAAAAAAMGAAIAWAFSSMPADLASRVGFLMWGSIGGFAVAAAVLIAAGLGLLRLSGYARVLHVVLAVLALPALPVGTVAGMLLLAYFTKPGVRLLFSGGARAASQAATVRADAGSWTLTAANAVLGLTGLALAGFTVWGVLHEMASMTRKAEAAAILALRSVLSAETYYSSANAGAYDRLECLARPWQGCLPRYPPEGPYFLDPSLVTPRRGAYRFTFHPGPPPERFLPEVMSPTSMRGFAYVATPAGPAARRAFCVDAGGLVCVLAAAPAALPTGECPRPCERADVDLTPGRDLGG